MNAFPRPSYEREGDRDNQARVAASLEKLWHCRAVSLPRYYSVDYALITGTDNRIAALMEIKCRRIGWQYYPTLLLSVTKLIAMETLASEMKVPAFLVVQWTDRLGYMNINGLLARTEAFYIGGRVDRDDPQDIEPVIHIATSEFHLI